MARHDVEPRNGTSVACEVHGRNLHRDRGSGTEAAAARASMQLIRGSFGPRVIPAALDSCVVTTQNLSEISPDLLVRCSKQIPRVPDQARNRDLGALACRCARKVGWHCL